MGTGTRTSRLPDGTRRIKPFPVSCSARQVFFSARPYRFPVRPLFIPAPSGSPRRSPGSRPGMSAFVRRPPAFLAGLSGFFSGPSGLPHGWTGKKGRRSGERKRTGGAQRRAGRRRQMDSRGRETGGRLSGALSRCFRVRDGASYAGSARAGPCRRLSHRKRPGWRRLWCSCRTPARRGRPRCRQASGCR